MKKIIVGLFVLVAGITLSACNVTTTNAPVFNDVEDIYAFQAVSASELLLSASQPQVATTYPLSVKPLEEVTEEPIVTENIDILDKYLTMMEQFLGQDNGLSVVATVSDDPLYETKIVYTTRNLAGESVVYTLYFNDEVYEVPVDDEEGETTTTTTTESADTSTDPLSMGGQHEFHFDDEEDNAVVYSLSGILIVGDLTYELEGKKIVSDSEEVLILRSFIDQNNFVKVRYQTDVEDGDQKFFYEIVSEGIIVNRSKVKVQTEDGVLHAKLDITEGLNSGKYDFFQEVEGNVTYIRIRYELRTENNVTERGMIHITATYDETTQETTYEYRLRPENKSEHAFSKKHSEHHGEGGHMGEGNQPIING